MTDKYRYVDQTNGIRVEEHDHTVRLSIKEPIHLTPEEADQVAGALTTAASRVRAESPKKEAGGGRGGGFSLGSALIIAGYALATLVTPAVAQGACGAIRDFEQRQACIAVQDGNSAECASLRDSDTRVWCRIKADNRRSLR